MVVAAGYLVDTNILLRIPRKGDPQHLLIREALGELNRRRAWLYVSLQNVAEFWNVCTRPVERNGFGLSLEETNRFVRSIERTMTLIVDTHEVYAVWRRLVVEHGVRGTQVHDARLAAITEVHGIRSILTLNQADFKRFSQVVAIHPSEIR